MQEVDMASHYRTPPQPGYNTNASNIKKKRRKTPQPVEFKSSQSEIEMEIPDPVVEPPTPMPNTPDMPEDELVEPEPPKRRRGLQRQFGHDADYKPAPEGDPSEAAIEGTPEDAPVFGSTTECKF